MLEGAGLIGKDSAGEAGLAGTAGARAPGLETSAKPWNRLLIIFGGPHLHRFMARCAV